MILAKGFCAPAFEGVREIFEQSLQSGEEVGAAVSVVRHGETVVDLWGGYKEKEKIAPWEKDTIVCCMSSSKGIAAICMMMAVDRGLIDLDAPVARYWPEFAQNGKESLPVRYVLDHRAGLPYIEDLGPGAFFDYDAVVAQLAKQKAVWEPGTVAAYHVVTQGYLLGEILRRVTGKTIGAFFRSEISEPLSVDFNIALTPEEQARCAHFIVAEELFRARHMEPPTILSRGFDQFPAGPMDDVLNSKEWRGADIASGSGHGNARALARLWGAVANGAVLDGVRLMSPESLKLLATMQHDMVEIRHNRVYRQGLGLVLNSPPTMGFGPNPNAFGHGGIGGSLGFADPDNAIGFGYSPNRMHNGPDAGPRAGRLVGATYAALGL
jgi:CubicO group peptidase (beta-lactamase class C family)